MKNYHVAVVGATGAVGNEMIKVLEQRQFPIGKLTLLAVPPYTDATYAYNVVMTAASALDSSTPDQLLGNRAQGHHVPALPDLVNCLDVVEPWVVVHAARGWHGERTAHPCRIA